MKKTDHPLYYYWSRMKGACQSQGHAEYKYVGAKGIKIYPAWQDFNNFIAYVEVELGPKPENTTFARIDRDKDFVPGNVSWQEPYACRRINLGEKQKSPYVGVVWDKKGRSKPWKAQILIKGINTHLGYFATAKEAAEAYDRKAVTLGKKKLNFV